MKNLELRLILKYLKKHKEMSLATVYNGIIDNATVSFIEYNQILYFASFEDTLKIFNISRNNNVAIVINSIQIHGNCFKVKKNSDEYFYIKKRYLKKFPYYSVFFEYEDNTFYKVNIKVLWKYSYKNDITERKKIVLDSKYDKKLPQLKIQKILKKKEEQYKLF